MPRYIFLAVAMFAIMMFAYSVQAREQIRVVGSSTVYPFSAAVSEALSKVSDSPTPVIETTGTGGGLKLFCDGVGVDTPDITNASRRIKDSERARCLANGVTPVEVVFGYDGIVVANSKEGNLFSFTTRTLFLALAKEVPIDGVIKENPYTRWNQIDPLLPDIKIEVLGPPPTSGTRDAFIELVMVPGAKDIPLLTMMSKDDFKTISHTFREDGAFIEAGENDNLIVQKLRTNKNALGIFGFSFLEQNMDIIQGSHINGGEPTFDNIADGAYAVSRELFFYVKKEHIKVIPNMLEYVEMFLSERMSGEEGFLLDKGLIPMSEDELLEAREYVIGQLTGE